MRLSRKNGRGTMYVVPRHTYFLEVKNMNMKTNVNKLISLLMAVVLLGSILMLTGCQKAPVVIQESDTYIVLNVTEESLNGQTDKVLIDYMDDLAKKGELVCTIADGMVTSINGIANAADYSSCWMLYTSDTENANSAWGTIEYNGTEYGSAISGAETLKIKAGQLYIWVYQSF